MSYGVVTVWQSNKGALDVESKQFEGLVFGIPKEIMAGEKRVAAIPDTVKKFVAAGATVLVEKGAGQGYFALDEDYKRSGADILDDPKEIYAQADVILKVKEPQFNSAHNIHEVDMMHAGQILITFLHPAAPINHEMIKNLAAKGVTGLTLDGIPRISRAQSMDALTSMSTVAGYKSVVMATDRLAKFVPMIGTAVGMIQPSNVLVIGAGVAGLQAIATAKRLGAVVYAADIRPDAAEYVKSLGARVVDTGVPQDVAVGKGGYANRLSDQWLEKEREAIKDTVIKSDIVILTALVPGKVAPILVTEEMVKNMKHGSAIVDVAIDQGGNCELTVGGEVVLRHGVSIDGTKNIPGMMPVSSTWMFANNLYNLVSAFCKDGEFVVDLSDEIMASIIVTQEGKLVHAGAREAMGLE